MAIEVLWGSGGLPSWRVLLGFAVKGLPYESRLLSFSRNEHKTPEALAINPRGKVPSLRDGAYTTYESLAILTYLDRKHPTPPLFGVTPEEAGTVMRTIMEHECYGQPAVQVFTRPLMQNKLDAHRDAVVSGLPALREELGRLEAQLGSRSWLAGETITAADIFVFPTWKLLERMLGKPAAATIDHGMDSLAAAWPKLGAWAARIEALPGYEATYPPHWRG